MSVRINYTDYGLSAESISRFHVGHLRHIQCWIDVEEAGWLEHEAYDLS